MHVASFHSCNKSNVFVDHDGEMHLVANCDCRHIECESQTFHHVNHIMWDTPILEYFHPRFSKSYPQFMHKIENTQKILKNAIPFKKSWE